MKKEVNTSLSARIKRRNACGFKGEGTNSGWTKKGIYGKWNDKYTGLVLGPGDLKLSIREQDKQREIGKNAQRGGRGRSHKNVKLM